MSIFIFITTLILAYFVVKIGAAAFELTGMDTEQASFQALSAFTGTGFTTKESELIVIHKQRRKIASALMILGNAGLVTLIATLVNSTKTDTPAPFMLMPSLEKLMPPFLIPYLNLGIILLLLYIIHKMFHSSSLAVALKRKIQQELVDSKYVQPACFEELLLNTKGYGVSQIEITQNNLLLDKTLAGSGLREHDILVLSIERGDEHILNPSSDTRFMLHDKLVCFGKMHNIRELAYEKR